MSRLTAWRVMTPMAPDDEQVLVARLSAGDTGAFDEVYDVYRPRVFAFLLRMTQKSSARRGSARRNVAPAGAPRDQAAP